MSTELILYSTHGCHLCEQAEALLKQIQQSKPVNWQVVDIIDDADLVKRYADSIPVLELKSTGELLYWPFSLLDVLRLV